MSRNLLPFLYQTRTLQFAYRRPATFLFAQRAAASTVIKRPPRKVDNSIPFEWDDAEQANIHEPPEQQGTLTPTETEIFKSIFDDISQGRLPKAKKRPQSAEEQADETPQEPAQADAGEERFGNTFVEQARDAQFGDEFLKRYPTSLRKAAENALGKFELAPARPKLREMTELDEAEAKQIAEAARFEKIRASEKKRVHALMQACKTDVELWGVMEDEVFALPGKLGIVQQVNNEMPKKVRRPRTLMRKSVAELVAATQQSETPEKEKRVMDVHGPLYSHYLTTGLGLFDTGFAKPSLLAFNILPRIKGLGLSSYVLGVSTPLFAKLAEIHWNRFGDAIAALDALDEMKSVGLYPNQEVEELVEQIGEHLHSCTWGAQGPFVMAMMESPPYDASLTARLEYWETRIAKLQLRRPEAEVET
ncbi:hypothetical protein FZEAL_2324 [Fusarium zealandicum]|uniref:Mtf2-like C-terminal domain-containing protein n=1 Tax=Fusarium zealandicum TaxID=1053134 RepID=A0A8H4XNQ9_9HYPO|nr:hypothetical protein FZEAL_2324 [Fusarium zealandicum]